MGYVYDVGRRCVRHCVLDALTRKLRGQRQRSPGAHWQPATRLPLPNNDMTCVERDSGEAAIAVR